MTGHGEVAGDGSNRTFLPTPTRQGEAWRARFLTRVGSPASHKPLTS